ncbi:hypothetical protein [Arthrobacter sp. Soil762]|uniref:hypothetical protein n=1 Tax=Arthrobacter sp. Soil762 TaxID=1736401 RepID=UPI0006FE3F46|nr:hypothetical protein [Arthrobacter sp. Soil762]KRE72700.1 hypothetical protein ASG77_08530 [Arthrobacter sp. Soil762]
METLRTQLRSQSEDIDHLEAENSDHRATIKNLQTEIAHVRTVQQADAQDLIQLAGRFLALSRGAGIELDIGTKELFRCRGWTTIARKAEARP